MSSWIAALRPRTLILVVSGSIAAVSVAFPHGINWITAGLVFLTALNLQILSNLSNDYGDSLHGADNAGRIGPTRSVQAGYISQAEMGRAMLFATGISALSGTLLLIYVYRMVGPVYFGGFAVLGALAIWAAIAYTATDRPYGYRGFGDVMVFIFFGLIIVAGGAGLIANTFTLDGLLLGAGFGFIATAVLNVNNLRDLENDQRAGKITIAVRLGPRRARIYHAALLLSAILAFTVFSAYFTYTPLGWLWLLFCPLLILHLWRIQGDAQSLDKLIPQLTIFSLVTAVAFLIQSAV